MSYPTHSDEIQRGIDWLNKHGPDDWRERIDIDTLDLGAFNCCPLGQIYSHFHKGVDALRLANAGIVEHGFNLLYDEIIAYGYGPFTNEWKEALNEQAPKHTE